jgi:hypothetical protein
MRYLLTVIFLLWATIGFATGQRGELVIYKGDTLEMLSEPLEVYLRNNEPRTKFHPSLENGCSTALWRGYVGLWRIDNGRLMLVDVYVCGDKGQSIKQIILKNQPGEIFADWFSGDLFIEKGKVIKYNHSGYDRYYETEFVVNVQGGNVGSEQEYKNGVKPDDKRFTRDINKIIEEIYSKIAWRKLPKLSGEKKVFVSLTLDNGRLLPDTLIDKQDIEEVYKTELKRVISEFPEVQVFYSRGQPLREGYYGAIIFSTQNKRKYGR